MKNIINTNIYKKYLIIFTIILTGCGNFKKKELQSNETVSLEFNYDSLIFEARKFIPEIGKRGGTLTLTMYKEPVSFNPITSTETIPYIFEGLVCINGNTGKSEPCLAERWTTSNDKLEWKFFIRENIIWSDSVPFSAYDVEFTFNSLIYNREINPNIPRDMFTINNKIISVTAIDSKTVLFKLPEKFTPFLAYMSQGILPKHIYEKSVKQGTFADSLCVGTTLENIVGTGPFLLSSYITFDNLTLKRNPLYWKKDSAGNSLPYLDSLVYVIVSDLDDALDCFTKREIDYLTADGKDFEELKQKDAYFSIHHIGPAFGSNFILFNQNRERDTITGRLYVDSIKQNWFNNRMFRTAVAYSIDRKHIIDSLLRGRGYAQWSPLSPAVGCFHNPDVPKYPFNLKKAKQILLNEEFRDIDGDGILEDRDSNKVDFAFLTTSGNTLRKNIAEIICKDLEKLGFKIHLQFYDSKTILRKIYNPPFDWEMAMLGLTGGIEPNLAREIWHSSGRNHFWFPNQEIPATAWEARISTLFDLGTAVLDTAARKAIYDEWQEIAAYELPLIYTVRSERILCISKKIGNINPSIHGGLLHNIEEFFFE